MPDWHDIKVVSPREHGKDQRLEIDGVRIKGVKRVVIVTDVMDANKVYISMYAKSINAEVEAPVDVPESPDPEELLGGPR